MKNLPWIVGAIGAAVYFTVFETLAFVHPDSFNTLSHFVSSIGAAWPFFLVIFGYALGVLSAHFFWPWADNPMGKGGG